MNFLHTFAEQSRADLASSVRSVTTIDLPEVRGWREASHPDVLAAAKIYNERKGAEHRARLLAMLEGK